jgi:hypothetical protein
MEPNRTTENMRNYKVVFGIPQNEIHQSDGTCVGDLTPAPWVRAVKIRNRDGNGSGRERTDER